MTHHPDSAYKEDFCVALACTRFWHSAPVGTHASISMLSVSCRIAYTLELCLKLCMIPMHFACIQDYICAVHNTQGGPFV